jgi:xanthine dehydrogenase small subunit
MACGGLAATIKRATHAESVVVGAKWNEETIENASQALAQDFAPITDMRASADYRLRAAQNLLRRFYLETRGELPQTVYSYGRQG